MMQTVDLRGMPRSRTSFDGLVPRAASDVAHAMESAATLIHDVRQRGEEALLEQADRFDGARPASLRVSPAEIAAAVDSLDPAVRRALDEMISRVRAGSAAQLPEPRVTPMADGAEVEQRWAPVARAGLYVPGGKAVYSSSVVMNVVPAQVAGVRSIAIASPPQRSFGGAVHPTILGAAGLLSIDEVYAMGGAGAIGALAYGVPGLDLEPVSVITGPGNVYVAAAKRLVRGQVGIDSEAGPTEILVIADASADVSFVAADLVSQAEHDELAAAVLVTDSPDLAADVAAEVGRISGLTASTVRVVEALSGAQSAIVLVDDIEAAAKFSNAYAPEHLSIQTQNPDAVLDLIDNAGAIFLGSHSPVSLGDYLAGSNHVLPTGGQAKFSSGLGAYTFLRPQQVIRYSRAALAEVADRIVDIANAEDLPAHGEAVTTRFRTA